MNINKKPTLKDIEDSSAQLTKVLNKMQDYSDKLSNKELEISDKEAFRKVLEDLGKAAKEFGDNAEKIKKQMEAYSNGA